MECASIVYLASMYQNLSMAMVILGLIGVCGSAIIGLLQEIEITGNIKINKIGLFVLFISVCLCFGAVFIPQKAYYTAKYPECAVFIIENQRCEVIE